VATNKLYLRIYQVVKRIPYGKVVTYGMIAKKLKTSPRVVGNALHHNPNPFQIPCHRLVSSDGAIAQNYAFGGAKKQRERLLKEGVKFKDKLRVDIKYYRST
jgi:methylated-DNA-protein-cysteine methyltransferase-like protein